MLLILLIYVLDKILEVCNRFINHHRSFPSAIIHLKSKIYYIIYPCVRQFVHEEEIIGRVLQKIKNHAGQNVTGLSMLP